MTSMAMGDDDKNVDGDSAPGNKVDDDGDSMMGDDKDDDDNDDGDGAMGSGATGYNNDNDGNGGRRQRH